GLFAALTQHRVNIPAQQRRDVNFHLLPIEVGLTDNIAVNRPGFVFWEHDSRFRADARTGRTIGFAIVVGLHLDFLLLIDAVNAKETKAQALHAIGAAIVIDHREPRLPLAVRDRAGFGSHPLHSFVQTRSIESSDVFKANRNVITALLSWRFSFPEFA